MDASENFSERLKVVQLFGFSKGVCWGSNNRLVVHDDKTVCMTEWNNVEHAAW